MTEEALILSHIARVSLVQSRSLEDSIALVKARGMMDEQALIEHPPFFWRAEISSDLLDSHFTHMSMKTLENYARDAQNGVAFLPGHRHNELPIGYSIAGILEQVGTKNRVLGDFYTVSGLPETDGLITRMRTGLLRDVSVGFHGGEMRCDICHEDFWDCRHYPGLKYETKEGDTVRTLLATYEIDGAGLSEVSGVFDGSTPDAMILKAQRAAKAGELTQDQAYLLENRYRIALPLTRSFAPAVPKQGESKMKEEDVVKVRTILGVASEDEIVAGVETLKSRAVTLEAEASEGRQYRLDLVQEALTQGVRAQGTQFDKTTYEEVLKTAPLATIKRMRDDWKGVADKLLTSGRQSLDDTEDKGRKVVVNAHVPDVAYGG